MEVWLAEKIVYIFITGLVGGIVTVITAMAIQRIRIKFLRRDLDHVTVKLNEIKKRVSRLEFKK